MSDRSLLREAPAALGAKVRSGELAATELVGVALAAIEADDPRPRRASSPSTAIGPWPRPPRSTPRSRRARTLARSPACRSGSRTTRTPSATSPPSVRRGGGTTHRPSATRCSSPSCAPPAASSSARPTCPSWRGRATRSTPGAGPRPTRGRSAAPPAAPRAARRRRWRPGSCRSARRPTAAVRSASRRRSAGSPASSPRSAASPRAARTRRGGRSCRPRACSPGASPTCIEPLDVVVGPDPTDIRSLPKPDTPWRHSLDDVGAPLRVAWSPTLGYAEIDDEVLAVCEKAVGVLAEQGAEVEEVPAIWDDDPIWDWLAIVSSANARTLAHLRGTDAWELVDPGLRRRRRLRPHPLRRGRARAASMPPTAATSPSSRCSTGRRSSCAPRWPARRPSLGGQGSINGVSTENWIQMTYGFNLTRSPAGHGVRRLHRRRHARRPAGGRPPARRRRRPPLPAAARAGPRPSTPSRPATAELSEGRHYAPRSLRGVWLSWLERCLHTAEVTGSSPVTPTEFRQVRVGFPLEATGLSGNGNARR